MLSALLMLRRVSAAFRYAVREEDFLQVFTAGPFLAALGTLTYQLIGIGILVEILRRLGRAFIEVREQEKESPPAPSSPPARP
jgi:hypothetical protein